MYHHHAQLGLKRSDLRYCCVIQDPANPHVWSSNKVFSITATTGDELLEMMREVDELLAHLPYRHVMIDPQTPEPCTAYLLAHDFSEDSVYVQMILTGALKTPFDPPPLKMHRVASDADWRTLHNLVRIDHAEGARTHGALDAEVTQGIVAGFRAKVGSCQFFLAEMNGQICAYGSGSLGLCDVKSQESVGMVEDLFTLPEFRSRGIATGVIKHCVDYCRERGAGPILIGSHAGEPPKRLYWSLGFEPMFVTRSLMKHVGKC